MKWMRRGHDELVPWARSNKKPEIMPRSSVAFCYTSALRNPRSAWQTHPGRPLIVFGVDWPMNTRLTDPKSPEADPKVSVSAGIVPTDCGPRGANIPLLLRQRVPSEEDAEGGSEVEFKVTGDGMPGVVQHRRHGCSRWPGTGFRHSGLSPVFWAIPVLPANHDCPSRSQHAP